MVLENTVSDKNNDAKLVSPANALQKDTGELAASEGHTLDEQFEEILLWAQNRIGNEELVQAREEFFWKMGKVFHDDPFYENRMNYFLDYFILERPAREKQSAEASHRTPFNLFEDEKGQCQNGPIAMTGFRHSVFEVRKHQSDSVLVIDLITDKKFEISARPTESFRLLQKKQIFQGFVYELGEVHYLSRGLLFHPDRAAKIVKKTIKNARKSGEFSDQRLLSTFAKHNLRFLRHSNLDPKRIYSEL
jgi:hypothetical protein